MTHTRALGSNSCCARRNWSCSGGGRSGMESRVSSILEWMNPQNPAPKIHMTSTTDYREGYANSVQVRVSLWDFFLSFGTVAQSAAENVSITNFQGIFLSPQQAKALANVLVQNVQQYESAFGEIKLEPRTPGTIQ